MMIGNTINECYHHWRFVGFYCQECGDFKNHGAIISQCIKCGVLWENEFGFFTLDEIENFKFMGIKIPSIIEIKGL